uniref:Uncharacterized protein n=1 Tax=viral metagenome TaxID=1070528 RepID=A0A6C0HS40_9ZZZZ
MTLILPNFTTATTEGTYGTYRPPETPSFNNVIYIVFDINHLVNINLLYKGGGGSGEPWFP